MTYLNQTIFGSDLVGLVRQWLESIKIDNPKVARFLCKMIPAQCPFERKIKLVMVQTC